MRASRLLQRLDAEIAAAPSRLQADCRRAERAGCLARLGRLAEARAELDALHRQYDRKPRMRVSSWVNLAEGLLAACGDDGTTGATDQVQRAHALSSAAGLQPLRALCAAWLAQRSYERSDERLDIDALAGHLQEALACAEPGHHAARARAALVAAQALHGAGRLDLAQKWYRSAQDHASADGDDATLSELMHRMAWLRMLTLRQRVLSGNSDPNAGEHALMSADSSEHFDAIVGSSHWQSIRPILRAQILSLQGDAALALPLYEVHLHGARSREIQPDDAGLHGAPAEKPPSAEAAASSAPEPVAPPSHLLADQAWCHAVLGQTSAARACAQRSLDGLGADRRRADERRVDRLQGDKRPVDPGLSPAMTTGDRAAAHSRLAQTFAALGDNIGQRDHATLASDAWATHVALQARIVERLAGLDDHGPAAADLPQAGAAAQPSS